MREIKVIRMSEDDLETERCAYLISPGDRPCPYKAVSGGVFCPQHQGPTISRQGKENLRKYRLQKVQERYAEFAGDPDIKSLRDEIGLCRLCLEGVFNRMIEASEDFGSGFVVYSDVILKTIYRIESLVVNCQRLEEKANFQLSIEQVLELASNFVEIVSNNPKLDIEDKQEIVDQIESTILSINQDQKLLGL